jgi:hypothetical protein
MRGRLLALAVIDHYGYACGHDYRSSGADDWFGIVDE